MADGAPESGPADALHDDRRKTETGNFNPAYQTLNRRRRRIRQRRGGRGLPYCTLPVSQQLLELTSLHPLENPGVHQHEPAISQHQDGAGKKYSLGPLKSLTQGSFDKLDSHFAPSPATYPA